MDKTEETNSENIEIEPDTTARETEIYLEEERGKNWDNENENTVGHWILKCDKETYIYEVVLEKTKNIYKWITMFILTFGIIQTLLSVAKLGMGTSIDKWIMLCFDIVFAILAGLITLLVNYLKIDKFEDNIQLYTSHVDKLDGFSSNLITTMDMKKELRPNGNIFVINNRDKFNNIIKNGPDIKSSDWKKAKKEYEKYISGKTNDNSYILLESYEDYYGRKRGNIEVYRKKRCLDTCVNDDDNNIV